MALGNPSLCPNIWEKNDTHLLHDFSYNPQNKAVNFQLTEKRVMFSIQGLTSELIWWYDSALTQTFKEMNMTIFFFLLYVGIQNWVNQSIKRVREKAANSLLSTHTPWDPGPGFKGNKRSQLQRRHRVLTEEADCIHSDARVKHIKCILGTQGNAITPYRLTQEQASLQTLWGWCVCLTGVPCVIKLL